MYREHVLDGMKSVPLLCPASGYAFAVVELSYVFVNWNWNRTDMGRLMIDQLAYVPEDRPLSSIRPCSSSTLKIRMPVY